MMTEKLDVGKTRHMPPTEPLDISDTDDTSAAGPLMLNQPMTNIQQRRAVLLLN